MPFPEQAPDDISLRRMPDKVEGITCDQGHSWRRRLGKHADVVRRDGRDSLYEYVAVSCGVVRVSV